MRGNPGNDVIVWLTTMTDQEILKDIANTSGVVVPPIRATEVNTIIVRISRGPIEVRLEHRWRRMCAKINL